MKQKNAVIVGRYQTFSLHPEQISMIKNVIENHSRTIIVLGNSLIRGTILNPLDFRARKAMIQEHFPKLDIFYINDVPNDNFIWSVNLDKIIKDNLEPENNDIIIYGSKDTVVAKYKGQYKTEIFEASMFVSVEEIQRKANLFFPNEQYRAGIIAAQSKRFPTAYQCVDVAVVDDNLRFLMAQKPNEIKWRFIGGFSDPTSSSLEEDAKREVMEETSIEVDGIHYLGSTLIKDSRYLNERSKIKTAFFIGKYIFGRPTALDDIAALRWMTKDEMIKDNISDFHHVLLDMLNEKFLNNSDLLKKYITNG